MTAHTAKGIVIAAGGTGAGKTTVALGLMAALGARGLAVQPYKVGPDYLDPGYHGRVCGRASINLDLWMTASEFARETFALHARGADAAIVEGVMGLYDGPGSTAETAKALGLPVLLVVDAYTAGETAAAVVLGCREFDRDLDIGGVVLNRVGGTAHADSIARVLGERCAVPVLGRLPRIPELELPERHLGLVSVHERGLEDVYVERLIEAVERHVDVEHVLAIAKSVEAALGPPERAGAVVRIGVARDEAFCFYYEDNLRLLGEAGAELVSFSPLHDVTLPENVGGLYLGGGFPEEFAAKLAENRPMLDALRDFAGPIYGECGGLMLLCEALIDARGRAHRMAGRVPGTVEMTGGLSGFGYREATLARNSILGPAGTTCRGHEFHWSRWQKPPSRGWGAYRIGDGLEGYADERTLVSYLHLHFGSNHKVARNFAAVCRRA